MAILNKLIYRFNTNPVKILAVFLSKVMFILKFIWKYKWLRITKIIPTRNKDGRLILSNIQSHYKATVPRQYGSVIRIDIIDAWNQTVSLEINPYIYYWSFFPSFIEIQLTCSTVVNWFLTNVLKNFNEKRIVFSTTWCLSN